MAVEAVQQVAAYQGSTRTSKEEKEKQKIQKDAPIASKSAESVSKTEQDQDDAAEVAKDNERVKKAVEEMNKRAMGNTEVRFGIHDKTNRIMIKIVDKQTEKVVKEYPPEETLDIVAKVLELAGIIVDEKM